MPASMRSSPEPVDNISDPPSPALSFTHHTKVVMSYPELPPSPVDSYASGFDETSATALEETRLTRKITRGTPGDQRRRIDLKNPHQRDMARKRGQFYENAFAVDPKPPFSARDRILRESIIMADIKTNVIIRDEFEFITDISYALSMRYQRPESSILVTLAHSCCVLYRGNSDPAYVLNITALPTQILPATNKRNAVLLAMSMEDALGVSAERGVIKFNAISEENLAYDGHTVAREIEELEKSQLESRCPARNLSSRGTLRSRRRPSIKSLRGYMTNQLPIHEEVTTVTPSSILESTHEISPTSERPAPVLVMEPRPDRVRKMGRRKSFMASIFGRSTLTRNNDIHA